MKPPLKAALCDLDGTLLNTRKDLANATNRALASAGYPVHPVEAYRRFVGNGLRTLVIRALPAGKETLPGAAKLALAVAVLIMAAIYALDIVALLTGGAA